VSVAAAANILAATAGRGDRSPDELMASPILEEPTDTGYGARRRRAMQLLFGEQPGAEAAVFW
jgi:hypothetical protein